MDHTFIVISMYLMTGLTTVDPLQEFRDHAARSALRRLSAAAIGWLPMKLMKSLEDRSAASDLVKHLFGFAVLVAIPYLFY